MILLYALWFHILIAFSLNSILSLRSSEKAEYITEDKPNGYKNFLGIVSNKKDLSEYTSLKSGKKGSAIIESEHVIPLDSIKIALNMCKNKEGLCEGSTMSKLKQLWENQMSISMLHTDHVETKSHGTQGRKGQEFREDIAIDFILGRFDKGIEKCLKQYEEVLESSRFEIYEEGLIEIADHYEKLGIVQFRKENNHVNLNGIKIMDKNNFNEKIKNSKRDPTIVRYLLKKLMHQLTENVSPMQEEIKNNPKAIPKNAVKKIKAKQFNSILESLTKRKGEYDIENSQKVKRKEENSNSETDSKDSNSISAVANTIPAHSNQHLNGRKRNSPDKVLSEESIESNKNKISNIRDKLIKGSGEVSSSQIDSKDPDSILTEKNSAPDNSHHSMNLRKRNHPDKVSSSKNRESNENKIRNVQKEKSVKSAIKEITSQETDSKGSGLILDKEISFPDHQKNSRKRNIPDKISSKENREPNENHNSMSKLRHNSDKSNRDTFSQNEIRSENIKSSEPIILGNVESKVNNEQQHLSKSMSEETNKKENNPNIENVERQAEKTNVQEIAGKFDSVEKNNPHSSDELWRDSDSGLVHSQKKGYDRIDRARKGRSLGKNGSQGQNSKNIQNNGISNIHQATKSKGNVIKSGKNNHPETGKGTKSKNNSSPRRNI